MGVNQQQGGKAAERTDTRSSAKVEGEDVSVPELPEVAWARTNSTRPLGEDMATTKMRKTPGICNGAACIGRTQIPVWQIVALRAQGCSDANLLNDYPQLTRDDLKAVHTYYAQHPEEIDAAIADEAAES